MREVGFEVKRLHGTGAKVFVVTDPGISRVGILNLVTDSLHREGITDIEVFKEVESDPSISCYKQAIEASDQFDFDVCIGLGGGSSIDVSKVVNAINVLGGEILDYVAPPTGRGERILTRGKPLIAIPTTSGTGSEVSPVAVISIPEKQLKVGMSSNQLRPDLGLIDPELTLSLPSEVTAATGMDALAHAVESYTTLPYSSRPKPNNSSERSIYTGSNVLTGTLALRAVKLIAQHLRPAVHSGHDIEAREGMSVASHLAGMAFSNSGVTACHAMAFPVGGQFHTPHGITNAVLLPSVIEYNIPSAPRKFAELANALGENIEGLSTREAASRCRDAIIRLSKDIGIRSGLEEFGVEKKHIPRLARDTMLIQRILKCNPRKVTQQALEEIFRSALRNW